MKKMRKALVFVFILLLSRTAVAQNLMDPRVAPLANANKGFDPGNLDKNIDPCTDFYRYACGGWMAKNPIPPDEAFWTRFHELLEWNRAILRTVLEKASADDARRSPNRQKIGDYYSTCMDENAINKAGLKPLETVLQHIAALRSKQQLAKLIAELHQMGLRDIPFLITAGEDFKDATQVIAIVDQGGLGLPDRNYYLREDQKSVETRKQYAIHVQRILELTGWKPQRAAESAKSVLEIETALAKGSLDMVRRVDPANRYHKLTVANLQRLTPSFSWTQYLAAISAPVIESLNVAVPDFFLGMEQLIQRASLEEWKSYLRWQVIHKEVAFLPEEFVNEDFAFFGKALTGAKELRPRWKRCVSATDVSLGDALGEAYVEETFGPESKARVLEMVHAIENAMKADIAELPWMSAETKAQATSKLAKVTNKIGYPDKWRDYSNLRIVRGEAMGNSLRATQFDFRRRLNQIGKPVDRLEWRMTVSTPNAYYRQQTNDINFPAGVLQPPIWDRRLDDAVNYGAIGGGIGHELTHGFDDGGRKFDGDGNMRDWWAPDDAKAFEERAQCFVEQYGSYVAIDDLKLNGKRTLSEAIADQGGLRLAYMALMSRLQQRPDLNIPTDGFSPEQRFFLGFAQINCVNNTPEIMRMWAQEDAHGPPQIRVNGTVSNMAKFQKAFSCKSGQAMVRANPCRVW
jgi:endothelin-converting enzyme/putative endopeptidase